MLVSKSTVDFKSKSFSWLEAGKLFRYMDKSILRELWSWSRSLTNFSFYNCEKWRERLQQLFTIKNHINEMSGSCSYPEIGGCKSVGSRDCGGCSRVRVVSVNIGQKGTHYGRYAVAQVLGRQTVKMPGKFIQNVILLQEYTFHFYDSRNIV